MSYRNKLMSLLVVLALVPTSAVAIEFETTVKYAYMVDYDTGNVLFEKNAEEKMGPSSMTKLMTAYLIFQALDEGRISLDTKMSVSEKAWRKGGSRMFVEVGDEVEVGKLLQGIIVQSGNDACIVMAEALSGTEENFAKEMTYVGQQMGLEKSTFKNATGWPDAGHEMTVKDLVTLATRLYEDFPQYMHYYSQREFEYGGIKQYNRNKLLDKDIGVDGFKTGYTSDNGYGITVTAEQDGRRVFLAINGATSSSERLREAERLVRHAFRDFQMESLYAAGDVVDEAPVWLGEQDSVELAVAEDVEFIAERLRGSREPDYDINVYYDAPFYAPVEAGAKVGRLEVSLNGKLLKTVPLVVAESVEKQGFISQFMSKLSYYFFGD